MNPVYIVDTSSWINIINYYPRDIFPSLWNELAHLIREKRVLAPKAVRSEIPSQSSRPENDQIYELNKLFRNNESMFVQNDSQILQFLSDITKKYYPDWSEDMESDYADPVVIAVARVPPKDSRIIVTEEKYERGKIPYIAKQYDLEAINLMGLSKREKWEF